VPEREPTPFATIERRGEVVHATVRPDYATRAALGHFPDEPLLPGSVLLALMSEAARHALATPRSLVGAERALFRRRVRPDDAIEVTARLDGDVHVRATVRAGGDVAASGRLRFEPPQ